MGDGAGLAEEGVRERGRRWRKACSEIAYPCLCLCLCLCKGDDSTDKFPYVLTYSTTVTEVLEYTLAV